jgi:hypothetical protein
MKLPETVIAWQPGPLPSHPEFLNPVKSARQVLGAVWWGSGVKKFSLDLYWTYLAYRVQVLLDEEPNPASALRELVSALNRVDLLWNEPERASEAGNVLVYQNEPLKNYLMSLSVPGKLPRELPQDSPKARYLLQNTNLEQWSNVLVMRPNPEVRYPIGPPAKAASRSAR